MIDDGLGPTNSVKFQGSGPAVVEQSPSEDFKNLLTGVKPPQGALRYDGTKPRIDLVPAEAILALAQHYTEGTKKYGSRNWEKGMDWSRCYNSLQRHALAWLGGEDLDNETGSHHMVAVAWNALALYCYALWGRGLDDREVHPIQEKDNV